MKKILPYTLLLLVSYNCIAQKELAISNLKFDTDYYNAIDKWVALPKKTTDSIYSFGFVYLDLNAGFTYNHESDFWINKNGDFVPLKKEFVGLMKQRLESQKTAKMCVLSEQIVQKLGMPIEPVWLKTYKTSNSEVETLTKTGFYLNEVGGSAKALDYLMKAYSLEPNYKGLEFEIGFAYNATQQYDKTIEILSKAVGNDPKNALLYKELGFAYLNTFKLLETEITYKKAIENSTDNLLNCEISINMVNFYFLQKMKFNFDQWAAITRKYALPNSQYANYIDYFEKEWESKRK